MRWLATALASLLLLLVWTEVEAWSWKVQTPSRLWLLIKPEENPSPRLSVNGGAVRVTGELPTLSENGTVYAARLTPAWESRKPTYGFATKEIIQFGKKDWIFIVPPLDLAPTSLRVELVGLDRGEVTRGFGHPQRNQFVMIGDRCRSNSRQTIAVLSFVLTKRIGSSQCYVNGSLTVNEDEIHIARLDLCELKNKDKVASELSVALRYQLDSNATEVDADFVQVIEYSDSLIVWIIPVFSDGSGDVHIERGTFTKVVEGKLSTTAADHELGFLISHNERGNRDLWRYACSQCLPSLDSKEQMFCFLAEHKLSQRELIEQNLKLTAANVEYVESLPTVQCMKMGQAVVEKLNVNDIRILLTNDLSEGALQSLFEVPPDFWKYGANFVVQSTNIKSVSTDGSIICLTFWTRQPSVCWKSDKSKGLQIVQDSPKLDIYNTLEMVPKGSHQCVITKNSTLICFGSNVYQKAMPPGYSDSKLNSLASCYSYQDSVYWNANNRDTLVSKSGSMCFNPEIPYKTISSTTQFNCAVASHNNGVTCWGRNIYNFLGPCFEMDQNRSSRVGKCIEFAGPAIDVKTGLAHTCALWANGSVSCWGDDSLHQVSDPPPLDTKFIAIDVGFRHSCAILAANGTISCWGGDRFGETAAPVAAGFSEISLGEDFSCAKNTYNSSDIQLVCWGKVSTEGAEFVPFGSEVEVQGKRINDPRKRFFQPYQLVSVENSPIRPFDTKCIPENGVLVSYKNLSAIVEASPEGQGNEIASCASVLGIGNCEIIALGDMKDPNSGKTIGFDGLFAGLGFLVCPDSEMLVEEGGARCAPFGYSYYMGMQDTSTFSPFEAFFYTFVLISSLFVLTYDSMLNPRLGPRRPPSSL